MNEDLKISPLPLFKDQELQKMQHLPLFKEWGLQDNASNNYKKNKKKPSSYGLPLMM